MKNNSKLIILFILAYLASIGSFLKSKNTEDTAYLLGVPIALIYILPSIIGRNKRKFNTIFWVNLFLGVTGIGWLIALIVALVPDKEPMRELL